jgi:hypothetical protein
MTGPDCGAEPDAHLARDDLRQRRLAEPRRAEEQHMVQRIAAPPRRLDEHAQILARRLLPDELVQALGAQRRVDILGTAAGGEEAVAIGHGAPYATGHHTRPNILRHLRTPMAAKFATSDAISANQACVPRGMMRAEHFIEAITKTLNGFGTDHHQRGRQRDDKGTRERGGNRSDRVTARKDDHRRTDT